MPECPHGHSAKDPTWRYVKQVKVRTGEYRYDSDNVILYKLQQIQGYTQFVFQDYVQESTKLRLSQDPGLLLPGVP